MKLLLTGASGFVGGAFLRRFAARDDLTLVGIGRRTNPQLPDSVRYLAHDLTEPLTLDFRPDVVIHAAALASPWGTEAEYRRQNIDATRNVIDFCRRNGLPRLLYVSSSSVLYRNEHQFGLHEDSPIGPDFVNLYAATKYAGEGLVNDYPGERSILRPRAVFGPGDTVLFPRILAAARKKRLPRFVGDGPPAIGDLIYIDSLADYLMRAATAPSLAGAYNLTNAEPVAIEAFLTRILAELGLPLPTRRVSIGAAMRAAALTEWCYRRLRLAGEPPITRFGVGVFAYSKTFRPDRTIRDFGAPSVSIEAGVAAFIRWQRQQWT